MADTLDRLLAHHGEGSKAIVWAHNTHVGDALHTDMRDDKMVNLGQLGREKYGADQVVLVGFGTHRGEVIAGGAWGDPWQEMKVPTAREGSWEDVLHRANNGADGLLVFPKDTPAELSDWRSNRAIGVVRRAARARARPRRAQPRARASARAHAALDPPRPSLARCAGLPAAVREVWELRADRPARALRRLPLHRPLARGPAALPVGRGHAVRGRAGDVPERHVRRTQAKRRRLKCTSSLPSASVRFCLHLSQRCLLA